MCLGQELADIITSQFRSLRNFPGRLVFVFLVTAVFAESTNAQFVDSFARPDSAELGNGWIEKNPSAFDLSGGAVRKLGVSTGYRNNVVYRPASEDLTEVETSIEIRFTSASPGYPQIFARLQSATVANNNSLNGYILYVNNRQTQAVLGRQVGSSFVTSLATIDINPALNTTDAHRLRLRVTGTNPVSLAAYVERWDGASWTVSGQATAVDSSAARIATPGAVGFGGYVESSYQYDNVETLDLGSGANPQPVIVSVNPSAAVEGGSAFLLTVTGSDFVSDSIVRWNGSDRATTYVSANELQAAITAADIATAGSTSVTVFSPAPGGGVSTAQTFTIDPGVVNNPIPVLTSINPTSADEGDPAFSLSVTGSDFVSDSIVRWNGSNRATTYVSANELQAAITAADIATAGSTSVTVFSPAPGGGVSTAQTFTIDPGVVNNPVPVLNSISPASATEGEPGFTLTLQGSDFVSDSVVRWNGSDRVTTFVSANELQAAITAADIATAGSVSVTVFSPAPGGGVSTAQTFTVESGGPVGGFDFLDDFDRPDSPALGNGWLEKNPGAFDLSGGVVRKLAVTAGYRDNVVYRPASEDILDVEASIEFGLLSASPGYPQLFTRVQQATAGVPYTLDGYILYVDDDLTEAVVGRQIGLNFLTSLAVMTISPALNTTDTYRMRLRTTGTSPVQVDSYIERWNGGAWQTVAQASVQDTSAQRIVTPGSVGFGGYVESTYNYDNFTRTTLGPGSNPIPVLNSISPASATEGGSGFTLTLQGSDFVPGSVVRWNGSDRATTYMATNQLQATITAADIATAGSASVTVFSPAPGGGASTAQTFTIDPGVVNNPVPVLNSINPTSATEGGSGFALTLQGNDFVPGSVVRWNGSDRATTYMATNQLQATITAADIATAGSADVTVFSPAPGGGVSAAQTFTIQNGSGGSPTLAITDVSPESTVSGTGSITLTIIGSNFDNQSTVNLNGAPRATTFVSQNELGVTLSSAETDTAATNTLTVASQAGEYSNPYPFLVVDPNSSYFFDNFNTADSDDIGNNWTEKNPDAFSIRDNEVTGVDTLPIVYRDNIVYRPETEDRRDVELSVEFVRQDPRGFAQLHARSRRATITTPNLLESYILYIEDFLYPNGGLAFAIGPDLVDTGECIIRLVPLPSPLQDGERYRMRFRVTGSNPVQLEGSVGWFDGTGWQELISDTVIHDDNTPPDPFYCDPGYMPPPIEVAGASGFSKWADAPENYDNFYWIDLTGSAAVPTVSAVTPEYVEEDGPGFTLLVSGNDFTPASVVRWNGSERPTSFVSPTTLQATIAAADLSEPSTVQISVFTAPPGGGLSGNVLLEIYPSGQQSNPVPDIQSTSPAVAVAGSGDLQVTVSGSGFVDGSVVRWNGADRSTSFVSSTTLVATISAADLASPGLALVSVFNPTPGGGTSGASTFTIIDGGEFFDDFNRADSNSLGNGWIEKSPSAFRIQANELQKMSVSSGYRDNIAYRPTTETMLDGETTVEVILASASPGYPQIFTRVQSATASQPGYLDGYILYIGDRLDRLELGRQNGGGWVNSLATLWLNENLIVGERYRMRLSATGTSPVMVSASIERMTDSGFVEIGSATVNDNSAQRIQLPGVAGISGYVEQQTYRYDNFRSRDLN